MYVFIHIGIHVCRLTHMGIFVCMYVHKYTFYTHTYVVMDECIYVCVYMLHGCIHLGMYIGRHKLVCMCMHECMQLLICVCMYVCM